MTRSKYEVPQEPLNWSYSPSEKKAIRACLPDRFRLDDHGVYELLGALEYRINHETGYPTSILLKEGEVMAEVVKRIRHLLEAKAFISGSPLISYDFGGTLNETTAGVKKAEQAGVEALDLMLEHYAALLDDMKKRFADLRRQYPAATGLAGRAFTERVLQAADTLWRTCGREPDMGAEYIAFLHAAAKPVLTCERFRDQYGASWPKEVVRSHIQLLQKRLGKHVGVQKRGAVSEATK